MIPMRFSTIFKNRWMAVLWAAGVIWFAYDVANSQPQGSNASANSGETDATGAPITGDDTNELAEEFDSF